MHIDINRIHKITKQLRLSSIKVYLIHIDPPYLKTFSLILIDPPYLKIFSLILIDPPYLKRFSLMLIDPSHLEKIFILPQ
jgi:16S rRNA G966 N2-methylase RsmD